MQLAVKSLAKKRKSKLAFLEFCHDDASVIFAMHISVKDVVI